MLVPLCLLFALYKIENWLLNIGILNKKDLGFVGNESGTFYEYITNIWYWDATIFLFTVLTIIISIMIITNLLHLKKGN
jgi:hypothetical protein